MKSKKYISILMEIFSAAFCFAQTSIKSEEAKAVIESRINGTYKKADQTPVIYNEDFEKGKELFSLNEPAKAIPYFEKSLESENVDPAVYIYLGVAYYQTKDYNKSLAICVQGLAKDNTDHKVLAYNAGNSCYAMGNYMRADASYAIAIKEDSAYAPPVLNRANAQLKMDRLEDARNNYIKYLELDPETPQRAKIEELIRLLQQEIVLRAKQKPELINPDEFVESEKMEIADEPEKVNEVIPVYAAEKQEEPEKVNENFVALADSSQYQYHETKTSQNKNQEKVDSIVPELPAARNEQNNGEKISDEFVALANENQDEKVGDEKDNSEKVDANVPALPVVAENKKDDDSEKIQDNLIALADENQNQKEEVKSEKVNVAAVPLPAENQNEKIQEEKSEKIKDAPPVLPVEKDEKVNEKPDETLVHVENLDPVKDENEKVASEKINPATLATDDYQKNEEAKEKAAREKAEQEAAIAKEKAEKEAELERQKQEQAERERQEAERKAAEERAEAERKAQAEREEAERKAAEESMIKMDDDDPYLNPTEVPDDVKVKENDDGTVDIKIPTLSFKVNSAELTDNKSNTETVQKVYDILSDKKYSDLDVTITGYVNPDNDEWTEDENKLALARAESVKQKLVKMGISADRIKSQHGSGKTDNKEYNRRVEFLLSKD